MTLDEFKMWLPKKFREVNEACGPDDDFFDKWDEFLAGFDPSHERLGYSCDWGEYGVPSYTSHLEGLLARGVRRFIVDDPLADGSSDVGMLSFDPAVVEARQDRASLTASSS